MRAWTRSMRTWVAGRRKMHFAQSIAWWHSTSTESRSTFTRFWALRTHGSRNRSTRCKSGSLPIRKRQSLWQEFRPVFWQGQLGYSPSRESTFCRAWAWVLCLQWASPQMLRWVLWAAWSLEACWSSFATWLCPVELIERLRRMLQERPGRFRAWWRLFVRCQAPSSHAKWSNWWLCMRAWSQPSLPTKTGSAIGALVKEVRSKYQWKWPLAAVSTSCAKLISKSGMNLLNAMAIWDAQCAEHSFRMFQVIFWFWDQEIQEAGVKESASVMEIFGIYSTYFRPRCTFFWGVSINGESPQMVGWFHGKSQSKMDDLGYPPWLRFHLHKPPYDFAALKRYGLIRQQMLLANKTYASIVDTISTDSEDWGDSHVLDESRHDPHI